jgi:hypothetical protein
LDADYHTGLESSPNPTPSNRWDRRRAMRGGPAGWLTGAPIRRGAVQPTRRDPGDADRGPSVASRPHTAGFRRALALASGSRGESRSAWPMSSPGGTRSAGHRFGRGVRGAQLAVTSPQRVIRAKVTRLAAQATIRLRHVRSSWGPSAGIVGAVAASLLRDRELLVESSMVARRARPRQDVVRRTLSLAVRLRASMPMTTALRACWGVRALPRVAASIADILSNVEL